MTKQQEIKIKADIIQHRLKLFRRLFKKEEQAIIEEWQDVMDECSHPDKIGNNEGYCPDCGYTFG